MNLQVSKTVLFISKLAYIKNSFEIRTSFFLVLSFQLGVPV
jgi:hypothetical protein